MCIGVPMRVLSAEASRALCEGPDGMQEIGTRLVGPLAPGDWVLVFLGDAREQIDETRAREVSDTLALVRAALRGEAGLNTAELFELPSRMSRETLDGLTGAAAPGLENA